MDSPTGQGRLIVVMGVSGVGKTTVGKRLAERLGVEFLEGDSFHPPANIAKMKNGEPLSDADRQPWLEILARELAARRWREPPVTLAFEDENGFRSLLLERLVRARTQRR